MIPPTGGATIRPKRVVPRKSVHLRVKVAGRWEAECLEIAALGMRIRCQGLLAVGSQVEATVEAEGRVVPFNAEVVWRHAPDLTSEFPGDMGLMIREPPQAYLDLVARLFAAE